jgi:phosphatidylglycerol:prolipoprotein diacylglycerol transferase
MSDLATLCALVYAWAFCQHFPNVSAIGLVTAILFGLLVHKLVLETKAAIGIVAARSFLQDCLLVIMPTFVVASICFGQPMHLMFAFLGTLLPLFGGIVRVGCFLGGCCYGVPSRVGIVYPKSIFASPPHRWRRYSPSPDPGVRVFPIQLVEAAIQAILFAALAVMAWRVPAALDSVFLLYLLLYAASRFMLDFFRTTSARPRHGRFSEAQLVCAVAATLCLAVLAWQCTLV